MAVLRSSPTILAAPDRPPPPPPPPSPPSRSSQRSFRRPTESKRLSTGSMSSNSSTSSVIRTPSANSGSKLAYLINELAEPPRFMLSESILTPAATPRSSLDESKLAPSTPSTTSTDPEASEFFQQLLALEAEHPKLTRARHRASTTNLTLIPAADPSSPDSTPNSPSSLDHDPNWRTSIPLPPPTGIEVETYPETPADWDQLDFEIYRLSTSRLEPEHPFTRHAFDDGTLAIALSSLPVYANSSWSDAAQLVEGFITSGMTPLDFASSQQTLALLPRLAKAYKKRQETPPHQDLKPPGWGSRLLSRSSSISGGSRLLRRTSSASVLGRPGISLPVSPAEWVPPPPPLPVAQDPAAEEAGYDFVCIGLNNDPMQPGHERSIEEQYEEQGRDAQRYAAQEWIGTEYYDLIAAWTRTGYMWGESAGLVYWSVEKTWVEALPGGAKNKGEEGEEDGKKTKSKAAVTRPGESGAGWKWSWHDVPWEMEKTEILAEPL